MPLYVIICRDKPGNLETRKANRDAHLAYIDATGVVQQAGAFLDDSGEMSGSLLILDVSDLTAAKDWAANDPYAKADLFEDVSIQRWNRVIG